MGAIITVVGTAQWIYGLIVPQSTTIIWEIPWYALVIVGLVIVLISSLKKAYVMYRDETERLRNENDTIRRESATKIRSLFRQQSYKPKKPLSVNCSIRAERRTLADIIPEIRQKRKTRLSESIGYLNIQNNSQEPLNIEVEYKITDGNVPLLARSIVDNTPHVENGRVLRVLEINPRGSYDLPFVVFGMVDKFHFGFRFLSWFMSKERRIDFRVEGRISTYTLFVRGLRKKPYIELELKIIATSALDERKFIERIFLCKLESDTETNEMRIKQLKREMI